MKRPAAPDVAGQRQPPQHVADGAQRPLRRLVEKGRHFGLVARDEQEPFAALSQAADNAAIMGRLGDRISVMPQQRADLVEQRTAARRDARHVLEHHQLGRVVLERLEHQPHAAQGQAIERLVLGQAAETLGQQAGNSLARRGQEHDVRALVPGRGLDVLRRRRAPAGGRGAAMEGRVLLSVEQIEHGARHAGEFFEVADRGRADVDATDAAERRLHVADACGAAIEPARPAAEAAKQVKVPDFAQLDGRAGGVGHRGCLHVFGEPPPGPASRSAEARA
jgi:hypothetical protein